MDDDPQQIGKALYDQTLAADCAPWIVWVICSNLLRTHCGRSGGEEKGP